MKNFRVCLLASVSSAALIGSAAAADMPTKAPPPVAAPVMSWTGPYIGINLGAAWNNAKFSDLGVPGTIPNLLYGTDRGANDPFWSPNRGASLAVGSWDTIIRRATLSLASKATSAGSPTKRA
jgi:opacity protein-like surface antigen